jgi:hypothetical protein
MSWLGFGAADRGDPRFDRGVGERRRGRDVGRFRGPHAVHLGEPGENERLRDPGARRRDLRVPVRRHRNAYRRRGHQKPDRWKI